MRSRLTALRVAAAAVLLIAVSAFGATAAQALGEGPARGGESVRDEGPVRIVLTPSVTAPGGAVAITVNGCRDPLAKVSSDAFREGTVTAGGDSDAGLFGNATVKSWATAGHYGVNVSCDGRTYGSLGSVQVAGSGGSGHRDQQGGPTPYAPVAAGGGAAANLVAARDAHLTGAHAVRSDATRQSAGPGTGYTVLGLVLAGIAATAVALRSVRRRRAPVRDAD